MRVIEERIQALLLGIQIYTQASYPYQWAMTLNNLGIAYNDRIAGEQADNLERAIAAYIAALEVYTRDAFPVDWAMTQNNLGMAYNDRIAGERADNLERAVDAYHAALQVYTHDAFPVQWAATQNNLGMAYHNRIAGERADNVERAVDAYHAALEVYTRDAFPVQWASTQNNLGAAYRRLIGGNTADNLERAIATYHDVLQVYTRDAFPVQWAMTQNNLGNAYSDRIAGERTDNLNQATACFKAALQVRTRDAFPRECEQTLLNVVAALAELHRWSDVQVQLREALSIEAQRFTEASDLQNQEAVLHDGRDVAGQLAVVMVQMGALADALIAVESGRARSLAQARQLAFADPARIRDPERRAGYLATRQALLMAQAELRRTNEGVRYLDHLAVYRHHKQDFDAFIAEIEAAHDPSDFLHQHITLDDIWQAAHCGPVGHALVYLLPTSWGGVALGAFTGTPDLPTSTRILALPLPDLTTTTLDTLIEVKSSDTSQRVIGGYLHAQEGYGFTLLVSWPGDTLRHTADAMVAAANGQQPSILALAVRLVLALPEYHDWADVPLDTLDTDQVRRLAGAIDHIFLQLEIQRSQERLAEIALRPLAAWLQEEGVTSVTLIPCGHLAAFSLPATPLYEVNGEIENFGDLITASVAPSALSLLHGNRTLPSRAGVVALGNPLPSHQTLEWSEAEAIILAGPQRCRIRYDATRDWFLAQIREALVFDASCHGVARGGDFLAYYLRLANGDTVTLRDALDGVADLHGLRLLILSACQTSIVNLRGATSEMRSLAVGFLQAGAHAVMGALWSVDDLATYLLMVRFAQEWFPNMNDEPPASALARAQRWLRMITWAELQVWTSQLVLPSIPNAEIAPEVIAQAEQVMANPQHDKAIRRADMPNVRDAIDFDTYGLRMDGTMADATVANRARRRSKMRPDERPFADPYYWAAFQITGW